MNTFRAVLQHDAEQRLGPGAVGRAEPQLFQLPHPRGNRSTRPLRPSPSATCRVLHLFTSFTAFTPVRRGGALLGAFPPMHCPRRFGVGGFFAGRREP